MTAGHKYIHVSTHFAKGPRTADLDKIFAAAADWLRYGPNCWILYTNLSEREWQDILTPLLSPDDRMFICEIDPKKRGGWLTQMCWDWLNKAR